MAATYETGSSRAVFVVGIEKYTQWVSNVEEVVVGISAPGLFVGSLHSTLRITHTVCRGQYFTPKATHASSSIRPDEPNSRACPA